MSSGGGDLLEIDPHELRFPFELNRQISCSLQLSNKTDDHVAFKVKTTNPKKYCVRPNNGVVLPRSTRDVIITMQAQKEAPPDLQCKDKFLVQSVLSGVRSAAEITPEMFNKESGNVMSECKLRVVYVSPPQPPSPVAEGSEEGSSPSHSASENNGSLSTELASAAKAFAETRDRSPEVSSLIVKLTDEKNLAIRQTQKLRQELELLRREANKQGGGFSLMVVVLIAVLGILVGYLLKR